MGNIRFLWKFWIIKEVNSFWWGAFYISTTLCPFLYLLLLLIGDVALSLTRNIKAGHGWCWFLPSLRYLFFILFTFINIFGIVLSQLRLCLVFGKYESLSKVLVGVVDCLLVGCIIRLKVKKSFWNH